MIEIEKTYLAKLLPKDLENCKSKEIYDIYIPKDAAHAALRLRKNGDTFELTKKTPAKEGDFSHLKEENIILTEDEFNMFRQIDGKEVRKIRYYYPLSSGNIAEIDVFQDKLKGLVLVDIEVQTENEKQAITMPGFCLCDVSQEEIIAGGMLCGKSYADIKEILKEKYKYYAVVNE